MMVIEKAADTAAHWPVEQYENVFSSAAPTRVALVLTEDNDIQGFVIARVVHDEWEVENIVVARAARRRGLGARLLNDVVERARAEGATAVSLEVRESNHAARALYEKQAMQESGRRRRYYQFPDEDAIFYRIDLFLVAPF